MAKQEMDWSGLTRYTDERPEISGHDLEELRKRAYEELRNEWEKLLASEEPEPTAEDE